jgi:hypothetical protein
MAKARVASNASSETAEGAAARSRSDTASTAPSAEQSAAAAPAATVPSGETRKSTAASRPPGSAPEIPGSELLGRGIYLSPRHPYELKDFVLKRGMRKSRTLSINGDPEHSYVIADDCEVNHSPPLPAGTYIGQTIIEESWSRFSRELTLNANAAVSAQGLSIDATSFHGSNLQSEDDSYYAMRRSFIPFYSVYLPRVDESVMAEGVASELTRAKIKVPFDPAHRAGYARAFDRLGTHYIKSAWIGGKASLVFVITKAAGLRKEEVKAGIEVTFSGNTGGISGETSGTSGNTSGTATSSTELQERLRTNSSCTVFGSGGDATTLAKLTTLKSEDYDSWVDSVKENPEVIEFGVAGIWTLLTDPHEAEALRQAYLWESKFSSLSCIIPYKGWLVLTKGNEAFDYARQIDHSTTPHAGIPSRLNGLYRLINNKEPPRGLTLLDYLPVLKPEPYSNFKQPHAAFSLPGFGKDPNWKLYLFDWRKCLRINLPIDDKSAATVDEGYPKSLSEDWPDIDFERIDAAVTVGPDKAFFFRGAEYIRLDRYDGGWRLGTKDLIKNRWPGVVFDKIDTAAYWGSNKIYFFSEDQYIRYDFGSHRADPGYPRALSSNYIDDWELFD